MAGVTALALLGGALAVGVAAQSDGTLAPGLRVAGLDVGGLTREQAMAALSERLTVPSVAVSVAEKSWNVPADRLGWRADTAASVAAAEQASRDRSWLERLEGMVGQGAPRELPLVVAVDPARARATLTELTRGIGTPPKNATVAFDPKRLKYVVKPDVPGRQPDVAAAANAYAADPGLRTLALNLTESKAQYTASVLQGYAERGNALMRPFSAQLQGTGRKGALTPLQVANLYWVRESGIVPDEKALQAAFGQLTNVVDQPARNARYALSGTKLVKVKEVAGRVTDRSAAFAAFKQAVLDPGLNSVTLASKPSRPTLTLAGLPDASKLQLISVGRSTYYHSSPERRTNVAVAASKIDGAVVPAGEVFSFLNALGGITPENGFVGGLIISGGRTVDGLGGGVCQVSTTTFRAMYQAGLPVVERNQHSYRVGYYEPQVGFEAAVYDPGVDLKFRNDTSGPLLIRTVNHAARSELEVQVWGIKPKRTVYVSPATIVSRTPHPAPQYVVNPRLRPGAVNQVDWAQDGYNLYITRTIRDEKGTRTDVTRTTYRPWQAVYEVGPRS